MTKTNETKRNAAIKATTDTSNMLNVGLKLEFSNGRTLNLYADMLTPAIATYAMIHGLKQKLVDAAAISCNKETGRSATIDDKYAAVREVYERLLSGEWNATREGGGNVGGLLYKALCRLMTAKTPEEIKTWLDGKTDKEKAALRANPKVAAIIAEIQAEKPDVEAIDTDALLGELESE